MGGLSVQQLPKRDARRPRSARLRSKCDRARLATHCRPRWSWTACRTCHANASWRLGLSAVIEDTSGGKSYWALAHPPGKPDFHHADCFALELPPAVTVMKFGIDRLLAEPALARAARGPARRAARASGFGHGRPDAFARCAGRLRRHQAHRRLRSAARPARRQAGQHDRVAGLQRSGARHPGVQPLRRGAQADRRDDGYVRRACWSICRISAAASTPSSRRCVTCSKRRRSIARRCGCWTGPIRSAGRSKV